MLSADTPGWRERRSARRWESQEVRAKSKTARSCREISNTQIIDHGPVGGGVAFGPDAIAISWLPSGQAQTAGWRRSEYEISGLPGPACRGGE